MQLIVSGAFLKGRSFEGGSNTIVKTNGFLTNTD